MPVSSRAAIIVYDSLYAFPIFVLREHIVGAALASVHIVVFLEKPWLSACRSLQSDPATGGKDASRKSCSHPCV